MTICCPGATPWGTYVTVATCCCIGEAMTLALGVAFATVHGVTAGAA